MKIVTFANLKGGVGKSAVVANLGAALAQAGTKVMVVDLDHQVPVQELMFGCLDGEPGAVRTINEFLQVVSVGNSVLPDLKTLWPEAEFVFIDSGPRHCDNLRCAWEQSSSCALVVTTEPQALLGGFRTARAALKSNPTLQLGALFNHAQTGTEVKTGFERFQATCRRLLDHDLCDFGTLGHNSALNKAWFKQEILAQTGKSKPLLGQLALIGTKLARQSETVPQEIGLLKGLLQPQDGATTLPEAA